MVFTEMKQADRMDYLIRKLDKSLREVISMEQQISPNNLATAEIPVHYGVTVKISGEINGVVLMNAKAKVLQAISDNVFGWKLSDWMLSSFAGEIVNMVAGYFTIELSVDGISTYLLEPKVTEDTVLYFSYKEGIQLTSILKDIGSLDLFLFLEEWSTEDA